MVLIERVPVTGALFSDIQIDSQCQTVITYPEAGKIEAVEQTCRSLRAEKIILPQLLVIAEHLTKLPIQNLLFLQYIKIKKCIYECDY